MSRGHVIVVDDNDLNRLLLIEILEHAGYETQSAASGDEALRMMQIRPPELALLDVQMPGMTGYELCREMKIRKRLEAVPVVFISALDLVDEKVRGFEVGGVDYVTKPFEPSEVLARVGAQINIYRLQRELRERNVELQRRNEQLARAQQQTARVFVALSDALVGTVLDETYLLEEKIGEGGFGAVFRATHLGLERKIAVKVLRPPAGVNTDEQLARFRREGIASCRIAHPNAVEVLDFGVSSTGVPYLAMELLHGRSLGSLVQEHRVLPVDRLAGIIAAVCDVVAAAHDSGVVHRDVKPDNVFLHTDGEREIVKVLDFGIARILDEDLSPTEVTQQGFFIGTPSFIAPERLLDSEYDGRSDIYSIGVMLYYCAVGRMPFKTRGAPGIPEMMKLHLSSKPRPIQEIEPTLHADFGELVMQTLERDPARRPPLKDLAAQLRAISIG